MPHDPDPTTPGTAAPEHHVSDNLPAAPTGPGGTPLSDAPTAALAFALGYAVARPQSADMFGPFCAVVEELMTRPSTAPAAARGTLGGYDRRSEFGSLMSTLPPELARSVVLLYQAQRGQRWARTGHRRAHS